MKKKVKATTTPTAPVAPITVPATMSDVQAKQKPPLSRKEIIKAMAIRQQQADVEIVKRYEDQAKKHDIALAEARAKEEMAALEKGRLFADQITAATGINCRVEHQGGYHRSQKTIDVTITFELPLSDSYLKVIEEGDAITSRLASECNEAKSRIYHSIHGSQGYYEKWVAFNLAEKEKKERVDPILKDPECVAKIDAILKSLRTTEAAIDSIEVK